MANALNATVIGRDDWSTATFGIRTSQGLQNVTGSVRLWFGVHRDKATRRWVLTHLPTGAMIGDADTEGQPIRAVATIRSLIDWSFTDRDGLARQDQTMVHAALRSHGISAPDDPKRLWRGGDQGLQAERAA
ncbi:hypothetical protein SAMN02982917_2323 [Azospirillum oryzae]|uniref:Uncharacterized protein n=1 Tax=Azospirillum oryzae TaxID=286727 RepID=A0A1X7F8N8_9PROT|nr:hypothetical protein [Azospirillum oryzae]SMF47494.1 hypothetical protein SAMN02982917_2323 [Azospirillum oryzae]